MGLIKNWIGKRSPNPQRMKVPRYLTKQRIQEFMNLYGEALGKRQSLISDERSLPVPKQTLRDCHEIALNDSNSPYEKNYLRAGYYILALYQPMRDEDAALVQAACPNLVINQNTSEELSEALLQILRPASTAENRVGQIARRCICEIETAQSRLYQYRD
jgi:hypothetical protein